MSAVDLWAEFNAARQNMTPPDRALLEGYGISATDIALLIGFQHVRVRVASGLFEPDDDGPAYVSPVLVEQPLTPESTSPAHAVRFGELVDLVAWHPQHPTRFALRVGAAEWLGTIEPQYMDPERVPIRRSVLSWFQSRCTGLLILSSSRLDQYRILGDCRAGVIAEDEAHKAELNKIMRQPWPAQPAIVQSMGHPHAG